MNLSTSRYIFTVKMIPIERAVVPSPGRQKQEVRGEVTPNNQVKQSGISTTESTSKIDFSSG